MNYDSINDIVEANRAAGKTFFGEFEMEKFKTELIDELFPHVGGDRIYFVTSDVDHEDQRHYKVRVFSKETRCVWGPYVAGKSTQHDDLDDALEMAKELAETPDKD